MEKVYREAIDRLLKALDRFGKNYGEFGTITDGEFFDDLFSAEDHLRKVLRGEP